MIYVVGGVSVGVVVAGVRKVVWLVGGVCSRSGRSGRCSSSSSGSSQRVVAVVAGCRSTSISSLPLCHSRTNAFLH